jgi:Zn-dependent protease
MFDSEIMALAPIWYVVFLLSLTCHEAAHALAADWGGDPTAALGGQVTLNPLPHIRREPFGTILVPIISLVLGGWMLGWASAPFDPYWQQRHPHRAAWMALAGPAANLILVIVAAIAIHTGIAMGYFSPPMSAGFTHIVDAEPGGIAESLAPFLSLLFSTNLLLMSFNLMPVAPLDGATVIGLFVSESVALKIYEFMRQPGMSLLGLVIAWRLFGEIFSPLFWFAISVLYTGVSYG